MEETPESLDPLDLLEAAEGLSGLDGADRELIDEPADKRTTRNSNLALPRRCIQQILRTTIGAASGRLPDGQGAVACGCCQSQHCASSWRCGAGRGGGGCSEGRMARHEGSGVQIPSAAGHSNLFALLRASIPEAFTSRARWLRPYCRSYPALPLSAAGWRRVTRRRYHGRSYEQLR